MADKRDLSIDVLRCIGLFGLFIAHISDSSLLLQIRDFDVPLMVFLSGICFYNPLTSSQSKGKDYWGYVKKRLIRLVLPAEVFMLLFFPLNILSYYFVKGEWNVNIQEIAHCLTLQTGWYVWIIRVFFVIAIVAPLAELLLSKTNQWVKLIIVAIVVLIYESIAGFIHNPYFIYAIMNIPYLIIFLYGYYIKAFSDKQITWLGVFLVVTFALIFVLRYHDKQGADWTFIYKYPPRLYWSLYGVAISTILYGLRNRLYVFLSFFRLSNLLVFIGQHTLWIYFWHIPFVYLGQLLGLTFWLRFAMVFTMPVVITYAQCVIVKRIGRSLTPETSNFLYTVLG